jgi:hypothetical protein
VLEKVASSIFVGRRTGGPQITDECDVEEGREELKRERGEKSVAHLGRELSVH